MIKIENIRGAQIVVEALKAEGVDTMFGYPGGANMVIYDALYDEKEINHILTRHEQAAIHAADGYARTTGKPGVVLATSGPGGTNLVTGLANAYMDSVPLVAITAQVGRSLLGKDSFQEADIVGITIPITKYSYLVKDIKDLARIFREAFHIATTGRPGPVLIDIPKDVTQEMADFIYPPEMDLPGYAVETNIDMAEVDAALKMICSASRPIMFVGGGVRNAGAAKEVLALAEKLNMPVSWSLMGKGVIPDDHELNIGMVGMHGTAYANYAFSECDLILGIGVRFDDRVTGKLSTFAKNASVVHVDIDDAEIDKIVPTSSAVHGDAKEVTQLFLQRLGEVEDRKDITQWHDRVGDWKRSHPLSYEQKDVIKPQYVLETINRLTKGECFATTEVGQNQMWSAQFLQVKTPEQFVTSGGLGTMGFGFPASIGVQLAHPDKTVLCLAGDGSFQMNIQELQTVKELNLPIKIVILNNGCLGMVRQWQDLFMDKRYACTVFSDKPDFVRIAEAYGIRGRMVMNPEEVEDAIKEALLHDGPYLLNIAIESEENVFPMVPAGGSLNNMLK
ncbi:biosynthetic-type acetolactate synthase large subunit [Clostridia bacterium]|nr:biosynthetic-type acetolactate synthase large subunit [Clostridia bacterium]